MMRWTVKHGTTEWLAREICWQEFSEAFRRSHSKAAYWRGIAASKREEYRARAGDFMWIMKNLSVEALRAAQGVG